MTGSMRTFVTDGQTDGLTDGAGYIGSEGGSNKPVLLVHFVTSAFHQVLLVLPLLILFLSSRVLLSFFSPLQLSVGPPKK